MNPRKLVEKTLRFEMPERIPRQKWILPWAEKTYPAEVKKLAADFPDDIVEAPVLYKKQPHISGDKYSPGEYTDEWGCRFTNIHGGVIGIVQEPLIGSWDDLDKLRAPVEMLSLDTDAVNGFCRNTDKFVIQGTFVRPFERFQFLRTMEQALIDLLTEPPEMFDLLRIIHEHYCRELEIWARTEIDALYLMDDWGAQDGLIASPDLFRRHFKPMYMDYAAIAAQNGKFLFMHSDGNIQDIMPDLVEIGIDALNSQLFCMNLKSLGDRFRGKITFWGEIDRQDTLALGSAADCEKAVQEVYENLYTDGGVIAQCEFGPGAKPENIFAVYRAWEKINHRSAGAHG